MSDKVTDRAREIVRGWPEWKKTYKLTKHSNDTPIKLTPLPPLK